MNANIINTQFKLKVIRSIYNKRYLFHQKSNFNKTFCENNIKSVINLLYLTSKGIKGHVRSLSTKESTCL